MKLYKPLAGWQLDWLPDQGRCFADPFGTSCLARLSHLRTSNHPPGSPPTSSSPSPSATDWAKYPRASTHRSLRQQPATKSTPPPHPDCGTLDSIDPDRRGLPG